MFTLVVVHLIALLNWSCLFTYVDVGCCVSESSAELELFVALLNWSYLFTYVYVGCCVSQSSVELELFVYLC